MKKLLLLMVAVCLVGCESSSIRNGRKAYKEYFNETLKDPESLRIYKEKIAYEGEREVKFEVEIGAKNSYGAYVRDTYYFHIIGDKIFKVNDEFWFDEDSKPALAPTPVLPKPKVEIKYELYKYRQYLSNSDVEGTFSVGEKLILKSPFLATESGARYTSLVVDFMTMDEERFNEYLGSGDYILLPKGTKMEVVEIFNDRPKKSIVDIGPGPEAVDCLKVKVITGKHKGEILFIGKFLQK